MTTGKKVFAGLAVIFLILLGVASFDISRRTTFPGSKPQLKERLKDMNADKDSIKSSEDSVLIVK